MLVALGFMLALAFVAPGAPVARAQIIPGLGAPAVSADAAPAPDEAAAKAPPADEILDLADIHARALETRTRLRAIRSEVRPRSPIERIEKSLAELKASIERDRARLAGAVGQETSESQLDFREELWTAVLLTTKGWDDLLSRRSTELQKVAAELRDMRALWRRTREAKRDEPLARVQQERIDETLAAIREAESEAVERRDFVWRLADESLGVQLTARDELDAIAEVRRQQRSALGATTAPPLWAGLALEPPAGGLAGAARDALVGQWTQIRFAVQYYAGRIVWHGAILAALAVLFLGLRRIARSWDEQDPALGAARRVMERPFASSLVVGMLLARLLYPLAPSSLFAIVGLLALAATLRILPGVLPSGLSAQSYGLAVLYFATQFVSVDAQGGAFERVLVLAVGGFGIAGLARLGVFVRRDRFPALVGGTKKAVVALLGLALLLLALGVVFNVVGKVRLGAFLTVSTIRAAFFAIFLFVAGLVLSGLWVAVLRSPLARRLRSVSIHGERMREVGLGVVRIGLVLFWAVNALRIFGVVEPIWNGLERALTASLEIRNLRLSLGMFVSFGLVLWAATLLSRLIRFFLDDDVLARLSLSRGVPQAVSVPLLYVCALLGFLAALAAAGLELSSLTILGGAFGIGLAFGMQNIVNNFVSGLILLYERPIHVGDAVEVGTLSGTVGQIGIRSSIVRTWDGADIIVPNADLIAREVTNWTRSDRRRRVTVAVGVAYGADPETVLRLLEDLARRDERILPEPAPSALFVRFGESSLDFVLRVWTGNYDDGLAIQSDLHVAVNRALAEAGIEIPYPQRDLHIRGIDGVSPAAADALATARPAPPGPASESGPGPARTAGTARPAGTGSRPAEPPVPVDSGDSGK